MSDYLDALDAMSSGGTEIKTKRATVDGKPVKVGDIVWTSDASGVRRTKMTKMHLGMWWESMVSKQIYATETAALAAALEREQKALRKAKVEFRRARKRIEVYRQRLGEGRMAKT